MPDHDISCLFQIQAFYSSFSEKEKQVADYVLTHSNQIIHETISQVAEKLGLAEATILRFCKRIGYKGYKALKISLASQMVKPIRDSHETINEKEEKGITELIFESNIRALESTMHVFDTHMYKAAVKSIVHARRVEFYGNGASGITALEAQYKFLSTSIPTSAYQDTHFQLMSVSQLNSQDVVIFISQSGTNQSLLEVLEVAKKHHVTTIGITTLGKSPLSKSVDIPLYTVSPIIDCHSEINYSRIAQISIIDSLYENVNAFLKKSQLQDLKVSDV